MNLIALRRRCFRLESCHGDGNAKAPSTARGALVSRGSGRSSRPSFLSTAERTARAGRLRRVLRSALPKVLSPEAGPSFSCTRDILPLAADRVLRGDRERTGHRMEGGRFVVFAGVFADRTGRTDAGSCDHLAHTPT